MTTTTVHGVPGDPTTFDLNVLVDPSARADLELGSGRLSVPGADDDDVSDAYSVAPDHKRVTIQDQGTWQIIGARIIFTPVRTFRGSPLDIALSLRSHSGHLSAPLPLKAAYPSVKDVAATASQGAPVTVDLSRGAANVMPSTFRFLIEDLPPGSTVSSDGQRVVIPDQGIWQITPGTTNARFEPAQDFRDSQPGPVRFTAYNSVGVAAAAGTVRLATPLLRTLSRTASYGQPIVFPVMHDAQDVSASTLRFITDGMPPGTVQHDGTHVEVPNQGKWELSPESGTATFTPQSPEVRRASEIAIIGANDEAMHTLPTRLKPMYPVVVGHKQFARLGHKVDISLLDRLDNIRPETLTIHVDRPGGTAMHSRESVTVPHQGTWSFSPDRMQLIFQPAPDLKGNPDPVAVKADDIDLVNKASAVFSVEYVQALPTIRDDVITGSADHPVTVDLLTNDAPVSIDQPFRRSSVELQSIQAPNLSNSSHWSGRVLVLPDQGTFAVYDGNMTFTPVDGFRGPTSPVTYFVTDSKGVTRGATLTVNIVPNVVTPPAPAGNGVLALADGLLPPDSSKFLLYITIMSLLLFDGAIALWVGRKIRGAEHSEH
ncbi:Ig-like domain-containing protein [Devriesea agamarum]|uniref:Ig-like domain-containing protein n=1 Tax=Devriesea agamarum TaxID=472569 RepID=UPI0012EDB99B|nr:Ig-like domain-containing protein [Devriesea agamarum]